ncbi:Snf7-domain-containing protein [Trametes coccinea BRFM310]|uniref:Vacuolar-sorting protein SNF7 n=1 Tax=Trametes coccinea (strain BRFM310) TaxID=1353009 RepID=A0A1Y2ICR1_TRAC3|nr:Snf7-domain-containing protein [Trametes coccinea BRFM310]
MAGIMSYFGGRRDPKQSSRDAIVTLRQQLQMIEKKEEYLQKKIEEETKKARANAVTNKAAATNALRRKKVTEQELERLQNTRFGLEMQVNTLESASFNAENMAAMKKASEALKTIHGKLTIDKVDQTMAEIQEQTQLANEVSNAISSNVVDVEIDEDELKQELADLEQDELNDRLMGADHVPVHHPAGPSRIEDKRQAVEDDEEAQLKELQAALAM